MKLARRRLVLGLATCVILAMSSTTKALNAETAAPPLPCEAAGWLPSGNAKIGSSAIIYLEAARLEERRAAAISTCVGGPSRDFNKFAMSAHIMVRAGELFHCAHDDVARDRLWRRSLQLYQDAVYGFDQQLRFNDVQAMIDGEVNEACDVMPAFSTFH